MSDSKKRKEVPGDDKGRSLKRSKGGSGGKWQTPHQAAKMASRGSGKVEAGDMGIWATCARRMEGRATEELKVMFEECAARFYGLEPEADEAEEEDIEASIQKEFASMDDKRDSLKLFSPVHVDIECVLFFKTQAPIDPVDFVHRICKDIVANPGIRRMRYANRLTPVTMIGKATEKGVEEVGKRVLGNYFRLSGGKEKDDIGKESTEKSKEGFTESTKEDAMEKPEGHLSPYSYAIRPTIRNHTTLKRDTVIKQVASMIDDVHKVNLTAPDKVIIIEIYQTVYGMSVIDGDWEELKRFNLAELYQSAKPPHGDNEVKSNPQTVNTDEG